MSPVSMYVCMSVSFACLCMKTCMNLIMYVGFCAQGCWCLSLHAAFPSLWAHVHICCHGTVPVTVCSETCLCVHKGHMYTKACASAIGMTGQCVGFPISSSLLPLEIDFLCSLPAKFPFPLAADCTTSLMGQSSLRSHIQKLILLSIHPDTCKLLSPKGVNVAVLWSPKDRDPRSVP